MNKLQSNLLFTLLFGLASIFAAPVFADSMTDSDARMSSDTDYDDTKSFSELDSNDDNVITANEAGESSALQNDFYEVATNGEIDRQAYLAWVDARPEGFEANDYDWFQMTDS